jgi:hypothetical protein
MGSLEEAGLDIDMDAELAGIQGTVAGLVPQTEKAVAITPGGVAENARTVEFLGRRFRVAEKIGLMPLLKFSAFSDVAVSDPRALGAMYAMLRDCIHPGHPGCGECADCKNGSEQACPEFDRGDWHAFEDHAMDTKADADDLMDVITATMELISGRPTKPPAASSPGRRATSGASTARSSARRARGSKR